MKRLIVCACVCTGLLGCAGQQVQIPKEVKVPVLAPCIEPQDVPAWPAVHSEADLLAMDEYRRTLQIWADYLQLLGALPKYQAIVEGCSRIQRLGSAAH